MAERDLKVVVSAKDEASSKLKKMNQSIQAGLKKTAIVAAAAGAALAVGVSKAVKAFQAQERAETKLETITRQTTNATDEQIKALKEQAAELQKVGVIGDEVTMVGQAQLATFGLQTEAIEKLTPAILDMAVNQKGVNATSEDLMNISNLVGKVMLGQTSALTRYGVTLTEAQAEQIKLGDEMERATVVAQVLEQNFGGLNEAMAETTEGQIAQMKNEFGDLMEKIGEALIPMLLELVGALRPVIESAAQWVQNNAQLVAGIVKFAAVILPVLIVLPLLVSAITAVGTVLAFVAANPIVLIIAGITALITAIFLLIKNWDKVKVKTAEVWQNIKQAIFIQIEAIKIMFQQFIEAVTGILAAGYEVITAGWDSFWGGMKSVAEAAVNFITGIVEKIVGAIIKVIEKLQELKEKAAAGFSKVGGAISGAAGAVASKFRANGGNVFAGQTAVVGEQGPELVRFGQTGQVVPTRRLGNGGTTININVSGNTMLSEAPEVAEKIGDMIIGQLRLQTRLS